jgi:hypothetical protein
MKKPVLDLIVNFGLFCSGFISAFSGLAIQFNYHIGHHEAIDTNNKVLGFDYSGWTDVHKISIVFLTIFAITHIARHWKWYSSVVRKKLFSKNSQVLTLTMIFILVALTGYIPWLINMSGGNEITRKVFMEIHDKLTLILIIFLVLHIIKRFKWFMGNIRRLIHH